MLQNQPQLSINAQSARLSQTSWYSICAVADLDRLQMCQLLYLLTAIHVLVFAAAFTVVQFHACQTTLPGAGEHCYKACLCIRCDYKSGLIWNECGLEQVWCNSLTIFLV